MLEFNRLDILKETINEELNDIKNEFENKYKSIIQELKKTISSKTNEIETHLTTIKSLEENVRNNKFEEENFNKVSMLRTLSKENDSLKNENTKLKLSLSMRSHEKEIVSMKNQETETETVCIINQEKEKEEISVKKDKVYTRVSIDGKKYYCNDNKLYLKKNGEMKYKGNLIEGKLVKKK
tara:strand:- start:140 stop:682 length:543 start_codon:yes stop_codon:yes gene_type:complete